MPPLKGLESAPEYFVEGIASIQFMGVNTRYVLYKTAIDGRGQPYRQVVFSAIAPTGALPTVLRQLVSFAIEHRLPVPFQDAT